MDGMPATTILQRDWITRLNFRYMNDFQPSKLPVDGRLDDCISPSQLQVPDFFFFSECFGLFFCLLVFFFNLLFPTFFFSPRRGFFFLEDSLGVAC